jgi:2-alkenal reductase
MNRFLTTALAFALLLSAAVGAGAASGGLTAWWLLERRGAAETPPADATDLAATGAGGAILATSTTEDDAFLDAVRATRPAVVTVLNLRFGRSSPFAPVKLITAGSGSGVIFDARGYVATNAHVVHEASQIEVLFIDGRRVQATLVNEDPRYDVAILRLPEGEKLPAVAPLADSSQLEPGMRVLAIGSPLGTDYQNTVTTGIIAGLNRRVKQQGFDLRTFEYRSLDVVDVPLIQTDAAINVGNSGGPLIDLKGEVVGLNTLVVRRDQNAGSAAIEGFGFSVPSNLIQALADSWIDGRPRGDLGLEAVELDPSFAREHGLSRAAGAVVQRLTAGGAGEQGDLKVGDIIVAVDGQPLNIDRALSDLLWRYRAGERMRLDVDRYGQMVELEITLGAWAEE